MKYFIAAVLLLSIYSCKKDFLELTDTASLNKQTYVKDLKTMEQFVNGIHMMLSRDLMKDASPAYADVVADNLKPSFILPAVLLPHYSWAQKAQFEPENSPTTESTAMNGEWKISYLDIRACNFVIEEIDKYKNEDPAKADKLKGQAYAIRAIIHFKLLNVFAQPFSFSANAQHIGIPYVKTSDITASVTRNTVAENYEDLIHDLQEAIKLMPPETKDTRYMNQLTAKAFLARVYLYKADFGKAKASALEVTQKVPMMTIDQGYPNKMYYNLSPEQTESLFQLTPMFAIFDPVPVITTFVGNSMKNMMFIATNDIAEILTESPDDIRKNWVTKFDKGWQATKFPAGVAGEHLVPGSDYYHTVIRSTEMFLVVAEASARSGDENTARDYLNKVRLRASPGASPITENGSALLDSIAKERRKELAFEGLRLFDLQRWRQSIVRKDFVVQGAEKIEWPSNKLIAPLPVQDVKITGIQQNTDY